MGLADGLAPGIGIFMSIFCGDAPGDALGICILVSIFCGDADGDGLVCGMFIPGMFLISWPCEMALLVDESINPVMMTALSPTTRMKAPRPNLFIVPSDKPPAKTIFENARAKAHVPAKKS